MPMGEASIYTRRGDDGTTGLLYGSRVSKDSAAPAAYGDVDETQAAIGLARAVADAELDAMLVGVQRDLWLVMAELACHPEKLDRLEETGSRPTQAMVEALEELIDDVSARFESPTEFIVPGGDETSAHLDMARTVCRRAERSVLSVVTDGSLVVPYLNRLSDLLWILARWREADPTTARESK